jgi:NAD-dependent dihydropyrimidine dehydrogenase PreA subunit
MKITRHLVQLTFLGLTVAAVFIVGGNAERWCPFGGVEALYSYATQGSMTCSLGVSNFFILGAVLLSVLLLRRAFCSYACPIGALSEWLQLGARRVGVQPLNVPRTLDKVLTLLKYPVLIVIIYFTWRTGELIFRGFDPCYALISRHGKDITFWAYVVSGAIVLGSLVLMLPFCRWLCPLAAVFTPFSRVGLARVKRRADTCVDCGVCAQVCPMGIEVDRVRDVTAAHCTACLDCLQACPQRTHGAMHWGPPDRLGRHWPQMAIVAIMLLCIGGAVAATYAFPLPAFVTELGERPAVVETLSLRVTGLTCRGSSSGMVERLQRDDHLQVAGYLKVEVWTDPALADVRITYDPARTSPAAIKRAIVADYFDLLTGRVNASPHRIEGYTPTVDDL